MFYIAAVTVTTRSQESPSIFKRGEYYYIIHGELCCFCERGSDAKVLVSMSPMGPYVYVNNINEFSFPQHVKAQSSNIIEVQTPSEKMYIWTADQWFSAASGSKGDDLQYWEPLVFKDEYVEPLQRTIPVPYRNAKVPTFLSNFDVLLSSNDDCETSELETCQLK